MAQADKILNALLEVYPGGISALDVFRLGGGLRAGARIHDLRKKGYNIDCNFKNGYFYYRLMDLCNVKDERAFFTKK